MRKVSCHSGWVVLLLTVVRAHSSPFTQISHHTSQSTIPSDAPGARLPLESLPLEEIERSDETGGGDFVSDALESVRRFV